MRARTLAAAATIAAVGLSSGTAAAAPSRAFVPATAASFLSEPGSVPLPLGDAVATLARTTDALAAAAGVPLSSLPRLRAANIPVVGAAHLAAVQASLFACIVATQDAVDGMGTDLTAFVTGQTGRPAQPHRLTGVSRCASALYAAVVALERWLGDSPVPLPALDLWPVSTIDDGTASVYRNDYLLIVDQGGDDIYANNAGSNMVDVNFAPATSVTPGPRGVGPAVGCQRAVPGVANGDCRPLAAVVLDLAGNDTYGVKESPEVDAVCTTDPVIRRMLVGGVGFAGAGILLDARGNDRYTGKTVSLGAGHVFGVGILHDRHGDDAYEAVRNSQGFGLVGGLGILRDDRGNDVYRYEIPSAIDPAAADQTQGAGGVIDDQGLCDRTPRFMQGTANVGAVGILNDRDGNDAYTGAFVGTFGAPSQTIAGNAGAQGFGANGSLGFLLDEGGHDRYTLNGFLGGLAPADGTFLPPDATCARSTCAGGLFWDR